MLNVVCLLGRLVADPEMKTTPSGKEVATVTIAVDRSFVRQGEERQADFIPLVVWNNTAKFLTQYFHKGSLIAVNGRLQTRKYQDKNGNNRTAFEIVADNVHFAGSKNEGNQIKQDAAPQNEGFEVIEADEDLPF